VHDSDHRRGVAISSLVSGGCLVSGAGIHNSLLFTGVRVNSYTHVERTVILPYVNVGRGARLRNCIVDSGVQIPDGLVIGDDPDLDGRRFRRTDRGISLVTQPMIDRLNT
jgi:glucose-1-phosphate adenylyltransferase